MIASSLFLFSRVINNENNSVISSNHLFKLSGALFWSVCGNFVLCARSECPSLLKRSKQSEADERVAKGTTKAERWIEHDSGSSKCARKVEPGEKNETVKEE